MYLILFILNRRGKVSDEADDLFAGLDEPKPKTTPSATKSDFMSSLFGTKTNNNNSSNNVGPNPTKARDFVLEEKYKTPSSSAASEESSVKPPMASQRSSCFRSLPPTPAPSPTSLNQGFCTASPYCLGGGWLSVEEEQSLVPISLYTLTLASHGSQATPLGITSTP